MVAVRPLGIGLNPDWIGLSVVEVAPTTVSAGPRGAKLLDHRLVRLAVPPEAWPKVVREVLAAAAGRALVLVLEAALADEPTFAPCAPAP